MSADQPFTATRDAIEEYLGERAVDLVGFAAAARLERELPAGLRPSSLLAGMRTLIVFGKRTLLGVSWARHLPSKQLAGGRTLRALDHAAEALVRALERVGFVSLPVSSAALDFERRTPHDVLPAGQGSELLRAAAVAAGLGTWGLNRMVLTPAFGPRLHFGGVLTECPLPVGEPLQDELCPGLEGCGRCAAVCPQQAIPLHARRGAPLAEVRALDRDACARSSQPFGFQAFSDHLAHVTGELEADAMWRRMRSRTTAEMWSEMAMMKEAALTGCSDCVQVCPVGADYQRLRHTPHRRHDLPERLEHRLHGDTVSVVHLGPPVRRKTTWEREEKKG